MLLNRIRTLLSLIFCSIAFLCRFRGGILLFRGTPECVLQHLRPASLFRASQRTGIGICSPPCSLASNLCPIAGCSLLSSYLLVNINIYSLVCVYLCWRLFVFSVLQGRVPVKSSVLRNRTSLFLLPLLLFGSRPPRSRLVSTPTCVISRQR